MLQKIGFKKFMTIIFAVSFLVIGLTGCSGKSTTSEKKTGDSTITGAKIEQIKKNGKLVVATGNYYPFEYHDEKTNELVGYDIDVARKIAKKIGVPVEFKEMQFTALIPTLQNKQADLVIAAMYITDERKKVVNFADSYIDTGIVLVKKASDTSIKSLDDINGKTAGVKTGATSEKAAQGLVDKGTKLTIKAYKDVPDYLTDLQLGRIDIAFNDYLNQMGYQKKNPNSKLEIVGKPVVEAGLGIGINKGDDDLLKLVNSVVKEMKDSGEDKKLFDKWLK